MKKMTKIVATIGPATESEEILEELMLAGMNVARFNTKHNEPSWHNEVINRAMKVAKKLNHNLGILLDLQGPEVRINLKNSQSFPLTKGERVILTADQNTTEKNVILVPPEIIESLIEENVVLLEDGACELMVIEKSAGQLVAIALDDCVINHRKTLNTPGVVLEMPSLTERDFEYLQNVDLNNVHFVGLSFVRNKQDIDILRQELKARKCEAKIVAKIENQAALDNLDEIIKESDMVMVARGDLAVETPYEKLSHYQKTIIEKCRISAKPVITATEMLKSMMEKPRPTRAEISDVANAIYDGTDAVMLSDETTIGKYPVKAVAVQAKIAEFNEPFMSHIIRTNEVDCHGLIHEAIANVTMRTIATTTLKIDKIVAFSRSGQTVRLISRFRPLIPIYAISYNERVTRELSLSYGVTALHMDREEFDLADIKAAAEVLKKYQVVNSGETVIFVYGNKFEQNATNSMTILKI